MHNKIEEINEQILAIQAHDLCPNCGRKITSEMVFCSGCGIKLEEPSNDDTEKVAFCSKCGEPLLEDASFCTACGAKIE